MVHLKRFFAIAWLCVSTLAAHAAGPNTDIFGVWKVQRVAGYADSFGLSERQIHAMIGKPIVIAAAQFSFNGRVCRNPSYSRRSEQSATYFRREWQANSSALPLPNPVTVIDTGCNLLYPSGKDHIVIAEDSGVFFEAVRVGKR